jgi:outer membrane protein OmpA-like peptidoglycan-associated protein
MLRSLAPSLSRVLWIMPVLFVAVACATPRNPNLEAAEMQYRAAEADPNVTAHAPTAMREAKTSLDRAQRAFADDEDEADVDHLAYLASRRVEIAQAIADKQSAVAATSDLGRERREAILDARTAEANRARAEAAALASQLTALRTAETERGMVVTVDDVLFEVDRSELKPGAQAELARVADFLRANPDREILIEGHADSTGTSTYNMDLSQARADAVSSVLARNGVEPSRIQTRGFGETRPIAPNETAAGRQQNRRVDIVVLNPLPARSEIVR